MKRIIPLVGALLLATICGAQEQDPAPPQDAKARMKSLQKEVNDFVQTFRQEQRKQAQEAAKNPTKGKMMRSFRMRPDFSPMVPKFAAAAADYRGTDDAVPFLLWIALSSGHKKAASTALDTLSSTHAGSSELAPLARMSERLPRLIGEAKSLALITAIRKQNKNPDVLGWLALSTHGKTIDSAAIDSDVYSKARSALVAAAKASTDKVLKRALKARIDLREKLGTGSIAPDIDGIDIDGVAFKLSDYKGKIVFLDFWGDW